MICEDTGRRVTCEYGSQAFESLNTAIGLSLGCGPMFFSGCKISTKEREWLMFLFGSILVELAGVALGNTCGREVVGYEIGTRFGYFRSSDYDMLTVYVRCHNTVFT